MTGRICAAVVAGAAAIIAAAPSAEAKLRHCDAKILVQHRSGPFFAPFELGAFTARGEAKLANKARRNAASNARTCVEDHTNTLNPASPASCRNANIIGYPLPNQNPLRLAMRRLCCDLGLRGVLDFTILVQTDGQRGCGGLNDALKRRKSQRTRPIIDGLTNCRTDAEAALSCGP